MTRALCERVSLELDHQGNLQVSPVVLGLRRAEHGPVSANSPARRFAFSTASRLLKAETGSSCLCVVPLCATRVTPSDAPCVRPGHGRFTRIPRTSNSHLILGLPSPFACPLIMKFLKFPSVRPDATPPGPGPSQVPRGRIQKRIRGKARGTASQGGPANLNRGSNFLPWSLVVGPIPGSWSREPLPAILDYHFLVRHRW
jgi:hypothetical protein